MNELIFPLIIFIYSILVVILIINIHERNKIIKKATVLFFSLSFIAIVFYDESILEKLIYYILKYIYYPSYHIYVFTVLFMILVFIYSVFSDKLSNKIRVFNYGFCAIAIVSYILFIICDVDVLVYKSLYSGTPLICLRTVTRGFAMWLLSVLLIKYYKYFVCKE